MAVIYRLASAVASVEGGFRFRWYRGGALDAALLLPGERSLGVIRQGATTDRTAFSDRVGWLVSTPNRCPALFWW